MSWLTNWLRGIVGCPAQLELRWLREELVNSYELTLADMEDELRIADIIPYWLTITRESEKRGFDRFMVAGLVDAESAFCRTASGDGGLSRGVMQLSQGAWIDVTGDKSTWYKAFVPREAIPVGLDYLRQCQTLCAGQGQPGLEWALGAYNWGKGNMVNHLKAGKKWEELPEQVRIHVQRYFSAAERLRQEVMSAE